MSVREPVRPFVWCRRRDRSSDVDETWDVWASSMGGTKLVGSGILNFGPYAAWKRWPPRAGYLFVCFLAHFGTNVFFQTHMLTLFSSPIHSRLCDHWFRCFKDVSNRKSGFTFWATLYEHMGILCVQLSCCTSSTDKLIGYVAQTMKLYGQMSRCRHQWLTVTRWCFRTIAWRRCRLLPMFSVVTGDARVVPVSRTFLKWKEHIDYYEFMLIFCVRLTKRRHVRTLWYTLWA